jgi:hypothetical protein
MLRRAVTSRKSAPSGTRTPNPVDESHDGDGDARCTSVLVSGHMVELRSSPASLWEWPCCDVSGHLSGRMISPPRARLGASPALLGPPSREGGGRSRGRTCIALAPVSSSAMLMAGPSTKRNPGPELHRREPPLRRRQGARIAAGAARSRALDTATDGLLVDAYYPMREGRCSTPVSADALDPPEKRRMTWASSVAASTACSYGGLPAESERASSSRRRAIPNRRSGYGGRVCSGDRVSRRNRAAASCISA